MAVLLAMIHTDKTVGERQRIRPFLENKPSAVRILCPAPNV